MTEALFAYRNQWFAGAAGARRDILAGIVVALALIPEAIGYISSRAKDKNIRVASVVEPGIDKIRGAKEYIQEVLTNLLANSVKYTPRDGKVDINIRDRGDRVPERKIRAENPCNVWRSRQFYLL